MAVDVVDGDLMTRVASIVLAAVVLLTGCSFGSDHERDTASRVKVVGFEEVDRDAYLQKNTYYVEIALDATKDEVLAAADASAILSDEDFEVRGKQGVIGDSLGSFSDLDNECQVYVNLMPDNRTTVRAGIVCDDSASRD